MPIATLTRDDLRRLAEVHPGEGLVLSVFVDLDPSEFGTAPARASQISSLLTDLRRQADAFDDLPHAAATALRADLARVEERLAAGDLADDGTRGFAVFVCEPAGLFEVVRLQHPVAARAVVAETPYLEPLAAAGTHGRWGVLLCNRRLARIFAGATPAALEETDRVEDDVHSQHDQGGWSQARYQRSVEEEAIAHVRHAAEELFKRHKRRPFDHLVVAAPEEALDDVVARLHPYLQERVAARVSIDIESSTLEEVRAVAQAACERLRSERVEQALARLREGLARGERAAAGAGDVRDALEQARVQTLLIDDRVPREVADEAIHRALEQSAEVLPLGDRPDLGPHEGIAAVLRF
jgi:peptide chain release factor subunit 1